MAEDWWLRRFARGWLSLAALQLQCFGVAFQCARPEHFISHVANADHVAMNTEIKLYCRLLVVVFLLMGFARMLAVYEFENTPLQLVSLATFVVQFAMTLVEAFLYKTFDHDKTAVIWLLVVSGASTLLLLTTLSWNPIRPSHEERKRLADNTIDTSYSAASTLRFGGQFVAKKKLK